jgi:putative tricarboxylic transport membrane protein
MRINAGIVVGLFMLVLVTVYAVTAVLLGPPFAEGELTSSFWPLVIAGVGYIACTVILIGEFRSRKDTERLWSLIPNKTPLMIMVMAGLYIAFLMPVGYWITTFLVSSVLTFVFEKSTPHRNTSTCMIFSAIAGLLITVAWFLLFTLALQVRLPKGILG